MMRQRHCAGIVTPGSIFSTQKKEIFDEFEV